MLILLRVVFSLLENKCRIFHRLSIKKLHLVLIYLQQKKDECGGSGFYAVLELMR